MTVALRDAVSPSDARHTSVSFSISQPSALSAVILAGLTPLPQQHHRLLISWLAPQLQAEPGDDHIHTLILTRTVSVGSSAGCRSSAMEILIKGRQLRSFRLWGRMPPGHPPRGGHQAHPTARRPQIHQWDNTSEYPNVGAGGDGWGEESLSISGWVVKKGWMDGWMGVCTAGGLGRRPVLNTFSTG